MRKDIQSPFRLFLLGATALCLSMTSCDDEGLSDNGTGDKVPLALSVSGIQTRNIIMGDTLPDGCTYGVFTVNTGNSVYAENGLNTPVSYVNGTSTTAAPIYLTIPGMDYQVMAYYPYQENPELPYTDIPLNLEAQYDYLYANKAVEGDFGIFVNQEMPQAVLQFRHALTRLTFRLRKDANNLKTYNILSVNLTQVYSQASLDLTDGRIYNEADPQTFYAKPNRGDLEDECVAEVLVTPGNSALAMELQVDFGDDVATVPVPVTTWESGQQYTYEVTVHDGALRIGEAVVTPWQIGDETDITINTQM